MGKTLLALESARRARAEGRRVLLVCFNHLLGAWLEEQALGWADHVVATTLHRQMMRVAGVPHSPGTPDARWWQEELPDLAVTRLLEAEAEDAPGQHVYDELIVDEAQDVLRGSYLDFLDLSLRGGLAAGRWRMFGDFENAAIYGSANLPLDEFLSTRAGATPVFSLRVNCRNTPLVAEWVHLFGGLDPRYTRIRRPDDSIQPKFQFYADPAAQGTLLVQVLDELADMGFRNEEIVILSGRGEHACAAAQVRQPPWRDRLRPIYRAGTGGYVRFGTIQGFKGLEAPAIILTDVDSIATDDDRALFYVGITRALQRLVILADERVKGEVVRAVSAFGGGGRETRS